MARMPGAVWRGPVPYNSGDGDRTPMEAADALRSYRGVVVHIAAGTFEGTIAWQHNDDSNVSSHFTVAKDGEIAQLVDSHDRAWTQRDGNSDWLSIENAAFLPEPLTAAQVEANAQIFAWAHRTHGVPLQLATSPSGSGLGHHSMGAENGVNWGHSACPGPAIKSQKPAILARAIEIVNGDDMALSEAERNDQLAMASRLLATVTLDPSVVNARVVPAGQLKSVPLIDLLRRVDFATAQIAPMARLVEALVAVVNAGGGDVSTGTLMAHIDKRAAEEIARDEAAQAEIAQLRAELAAANEREADAARGAAAAYGPDSATA